MNHYSPHALIARLGLFADQALFAETTARDTDSRELAFVTERWCNKMRSAVWGDYVRFSRRPMNAPEPQRETL